MTDNIKRTETTHIDEARRTSTSTVQWLLEKANIAGTHPISHNNRLTFLICGEQAFADIAQHIAAANSSIDICCWGFDPGMELNRGASPCWPRGETYGDLLIAAGKRGVKVRLLVWHDWAAVRASNPRNMPGHTHDVDARRRTHHPTRRIPNAAFSITMAQELASAMLVKPSHEKLLLTARRNYCMDWYDAALEGKLDNIEVRKRSGNIGAAMASLASEADAPPPSMEKAGLTYFGTHHQKPILIDFFHDEGRAAVAYVMGLNSLTEYWDSARHALEDPRREREQVHGTRADQAFATMMPYRDYACRIDGGRALVAVHNNFVKAWERAADSTPPSKSVAETPGMPEACLRKPRPGDCTVQIIRTQPEENDKTIKEAYFLATDQAALGMGYLYLENQYFQYAEWAQRLMRTRKTVMEKWSAASAASGRTERDMPIMHVFIVIPVPERTEMIPRTYDTLATLGQQAGMTGQEKMIERYNTTTPNILLDEQGRPFRVAQSLPEVVKDANRIMKPDEKLLESGYGLKVCTAMLNACDFADGKWRYREIYIHSKLLLIDDTYITLGSANLNQRSMAVDSEINLATVAPDKAADLRRRIWGQLSGGLVTGGDGSRREIAAAFKSWRNLMVANRSYLKEGGSLSGLLLPMEAARSSTIRLG